MTRKPTIVEALGILFIVLGLLGMGYYYKTTYAPSAVDNTLNQEANTLSENWSSQHHTTVTSTEDAKQIEPTKFKEGEAIGILHIPAWGKDHAVPIVEGVDADTLEKGVGRYPKSGTPGKVGNLAIAGHRSGDPQPFRHLLELKRGDKIIVETKIAKYTYVVREPADETTLKAADGGWAIHAPEIKDYPDKSTITLTTCTHLYRSDDRSILFGELEKMELKS